MRRPTKENKVRLNLLLTERTKNHLEELREISGADSIGEVVRRSAAVYDLFLREYSNNDIITLETPDGLKEKMRIIP